MMMKVAIMATVMVTVAAVAAVIVTVAVGGQWALAAGMRAGGLRGEDSAPSPQPAQSKAGATCPHCWHRHCSLATEGPSPAIRGGARGPFKRRGACR